MKLKHVVWRWVDAGCGGRAAAKLDCDYLEVIQLAGQAPPASLLPEMLDAALGEGWRQKAESLHTSREYPWLVECRERSSGAVDYLLRIQEGERFGNCPIVARLHISMVGKINNGFEAHLGDVAPLLAAAAEGFEKEAEVVFVEDPRKHEFNAPGTPSGLLSAT